MKIMSSLFLLLLLAGASFSLLNANSQSTNANFTVVIETNLGNPRREAYLYYLATVLPFLGINVKLSFKPFVQYVDDLIFTDPKPYDISIVSIGGGSVIAPDFYDLYHSEGFFGDLMYRLSSEEWKQWLPNDPANTAGITQDDADTLIDNIASNLDLFGERKDLTLQFQQMFMENLLFDYPLLAPTGIFSIWRGLENFDPEEGTLGSAYLGAQWGPETSSERQNNASTIAVGLFSITGNFDPLQVADSETSTVLSGLFPQLLMFSGRDYSPHPWLAKQFNATTWFDAPLGPNGTTVDVPYGKMDFYLYDDWQWGYPNGTVFGSVTVDDVKFSFELKMSSHIFLSAQSPALFSSIYNVTAYPAENKVSVFITKPTIDDLYAFGTMSIVPYTLLGGDLHFSNGTIIRALENTSASLPYTSYNPFDTVEWNAFEDNPIQAGPYYIDFADSNQYSAGQYVYKWANPMFTFPNEWDSSNFDMRTPETEDAYFFAWADDPNTAEKEKPTEMTITQFYLPILSNFNDVYTLFTSGNIDLFPHLHIYHSYLQSIITDQRFKIHTVQTTRTADLLVFNLLNPHLKKYNVRRAIAHMIDKVSLNAISIYLREPQDSPVKPFFKNNYYSDQWRIPFDYGEAKRLMIAEGYTVSDMPLSLPVFSPIFESSVDDFLQLNGNYFPAENTPEVTEANRSFPILWHSSTIMVLIVLPILISKKRKTVS